MDQEQHAVAARQRGADDLRGDHGVMGNREITEQKPAVAVDLESGVSPGSDGFN